MESSQGVRALGDQSEGVRRKRTNGVSKFGASRRGKTITPRVLSVSNRRSGPLDGLGKKFSRKALNKRGCFS